MTTPSEGLEGAVQRSSSGASGGLTLLREAPWAHRLVAVARIFVGFAFVPAGLKKVLGQPFTDPHLHGPFHDFLHAFHRTGSFYRFVGGAQLFAALLLMTGRFAPVGALVALPILTAILVLCWSTHVYPTASVVTAMWLTTLALVLWDRPWWRARLAREQTRSAPIACAPWERAGAGALVLYLVTCVATDSVYRPRGAAWESPAFYVFPAMLATLLAAYVIDRRSTTSRPGPSAPR